MIFSKLLPKPGTYAPIKQTEFKKLHVFSSASDQALPSQTPLFSLQWPNIYNSSGKGIKAGKVGGIDMIIANILS